MYRDRMNSYYPPVVQRILEFQAIIDGQYPEFETFSEAREQALADSFLTTMSEDRVEQWEKALGIVPVADSTVEDRRDTITARIRGQGKLNTELINTIVGTFTGGTANSWIEDSVLYVEITPPRNNKQFKFENVEQELSKKVPAHLGFNISRNYYDWSEVEANQGTWQTVNDDFDTWEEVYIYSTSYKGGS